MLFVDWSEPGEGLLVVGEDQDNIREIVKNKVLMYRSRRVK